jgi:GntR family transcriptional repressor for pyruvate dehydrogenase complex
MSGTPKPVKRALTTEQVVDEVREMIRRGDLKPGDRLPPEREMAKRLGISRPSLRAGLRFLAAMGVLSSRHGAGTFIADGPPALASEPLSMLAALHGFTPDEIFEARRVLEVGAAGLAAERATDQHLAAMAEELTEMYASFNEPQRYLIHDIRFHRAVADASGNPILATLMEMVSAVMYERRRQTVEQATDFKQSAALHHRIYRAIRSRDPEQARAAMSEHLSLARRALLSEEFAERKTAKPNQRRRRNRAAAGGEQPAAGKAGTRVKRRAS